MEQFATSRKIGYDAAVLDLPALRPQPIAVAVALRSPLDCDQMRPLAK